MHFVTFCSTCNMHITYVDEVHNGLQSRNERLYGIYSCIRFNDAYYAVVLRMLDFKVGCRRCLSI